MRRDTAAAKRTYLPARRDVRTRSGPRRSSRVDDRADAPWSPAVAPTATVLTGDGEGPIWRGSACVEAAYAGR